MGLLEDLGLKPRNGAQPAQQTIEALLALEQRIAALEAGRFNDTLAAAPVSPLIVKGEPAGLKLVKVGTHWELQNAAGVTQAVLVPTGGGVNSILENPTGETGGGVWTLNPTFSGPVRIEQTIGFSTAIQESPEGALGTVNLEAIATLQELVPLGPGASKIAGLTMGGNPVTGGGILIIRNGSASVKIELENEVAGALNNAFALFPKATYVLEPRAAIILYKGTTVKRLLNIGKS